MANNHGVNVAAKLKSTCTQLYKDKHALLTPLSPPPFPRLVILERVHQVTLRNLSDYDIASIHKLVIFEIAYLQVTYAFLIILCIDTSCEIYSTGTTRVSSN